MNVDERTNQYPPAVTIREEIETGDVLPFFGGPTYRFYSLSHWVAVSEYVAVGFADAEGVQVAVGMVCYAPITTERLRDLSVGFLTNVESHWPRWDSPSPPSPDELRRRWRKEIVGVVITVQVGNAPAAPVHSTRVEKVEDEPTLKRLDGELPDAFYARVAQFYMHFQDVTQRPTTSIAQAGQVPYTTAAKWVREARKRGHLAPSDKGGK